MAVYYWPLTLLHGFVFVGNNVDYWFKMEGWDLDTLFSHYWRSRLGGERERDKYFFIIFFSFWQIPLFFSLLRHFLSLTKWNLYNNFGLFFRYNFCSVARILGPVIWFFYSWLPIFCVFLTTGFLVHFWSDFIL